MEALWELVLLVNGDVGHFGQQVEHLLVLAGPRGHDAVAAVVQDLEAGELEQVQVLVEDDLVHRRPLLHRGHAVVRGDDDVECVGQAVAGDGLPEVAEGAVDLLDDLLPLGVVRPLVVAHVVGLPVVQGDQVEVLLGEPAHHLVDVLPPLRLVVVGCVSDLHQRPVHRLAAVVGAAPRVVEGCRFQALRHWTGSTH